MSMFFSDTEQQCNRNHVSVAMMLIIKLATVRILNQHLCNYQIISSGWCGVGDAGWAPSPALLQSLFLCCVSSSLKAEGAICCPLGICFGRPALIARGFVKVLLSGTSSMPWDDELPQPVPPMFWTLLSSGSHLFWGRLNLLLHRAISLQSAHCWDSGK